MNTRIKGILYSTLAIAGMFTFNSSAKAEEPNSEGKVPVSMTITASVDDGKRMPQLTGDDIMVKQGKEKLQVSGLTPAQGRSAGLDLFILIDDAADPSLGSHLDELRTFILSQPATTRVGVAYTRNATVFVNQDLTADHELAAGALRLPLGTAGAYGSPYLSVADLMKRWPQGENRREVILLSDGMDRARRTFLVHRGFSTNGDADTASVVAHRTGIIIHSIYVPGARLTRRDYWPLVSGQANMASLSEKTGGKSFYLGLQSPVSLKPYLDELQTVLDNQYVLSFAVRPGKKSGLQSVKLSTEVAGVRLVTHEAVWVPASR